MSLTEMIEFSHKELVIDIISSQTCNFDVLRMLLNDGLEVNEFF